jgi:ADP-heptose:LPS heptosyltransferase
MSLEIGPWKYWLLIRIAFLWNQVLCRRRKHYRLAIIKMDRIGDAVLAVGAIRLLIDRVGEDQSLLVISPIAESLYRAEFPRTDFLVLPISCISFWPEFVTFLWKYHSRFSGLSCDELVCLRHHPSDYLHAMMRLLPASVRYACEKKESYLGKAAVPFPDAVLSPYPEVLIGHCQELEAHRRVVSSVRGFEVPLEQIHSRLTVRASEVRTVLLVCPQASDEIRQYPPELLATVIQGFIAQHPMPVEFCVPPGTDIRVWDCANEAAGLNSVTWRFPATIPDLVQEIASVRILLAPESGPAHIATALDQPIVVLIGGGNFGNVAPWSKSPRQRWLNRPLDCYECGWKCVHASPICITEIPPVEVIQQLLAAFAEQ